MTAIKNEKEYTIPKRIFYVWGAGEKKRRDVNLCIQSWRNILPDYEIIEINEDSDKYFDFQKELNSNKFFRTVYNNKMWAYVADYIRIKVLYEHGGIYFDTDVSVLQSFDKFLKHPAFVGIQNERLTEPAILGAQKHNPFLKKVLNFYDNDNGGIWKLPIFTMPDIFEHFLINDYKIKGFPPKKSQKIIKTRDLVIYPEKIFIPFRYQQEFTPECIEPETHSIHWFGGSWTKRSVVEWLMNKHIKPDAKLDYTMDIKETIRLVLFKKRAIIKIIRYDNGNTDVKLFHNIPLFRLNKHRLYFCGLPIFRIKKEWQ